MQTERRKYFRHPIEIPVKVTPVQDEPVRRLSSNNFSQGGLQFVSQELIEAGKALELTFPIKDQLFCLDRKSVV